MFKAVIQSPMGGEGVEEVIFDIPSAVAYFPKSAAGELRKREGGCPPPMMLFNGFRPLLADTLSFGDGFIRMKHSQRDPNAFSGAKPFHIPKLRQASRLVPKTGLDLSKETLRILK